MADHPLPMAPHCLPKRARQPEADAPADRDLLDRFVAHRDQAAFAALVERHGPMVLRLCRRVLHRTHDAEDACQAAFLVLARKAASIRRKEALASWLHGVAYHVASNLRRAESRHGGRLAPRQEAVRQDPAADASWREVRTAIDQELAHLPQRYRAPLILCYLEERTRDEAARLLGWGEGTLRGRLERGRDALRARLIRRGIGLSSVLLAGALEGEAASPARALSVCTVGAERAVSAKVASLAQGVLKAMLFNKLRAGAAVVLVLSLAVAGSILAWGRGQPVRGSRVSPRPTPRPLFPPSPPNRPRRIPCASWSSTRRASRCRARTSIPASGPKKRASSPTTITRPTPPAPPRWSCRRPSPSFVCGPAKSRSSRCSPAGKRTNWRAERKSRPNTRSGWNPPSTAGGRIVDEQGKPIAGAKVQVMMWDDGEARRRRRPRRLRQLVGDRKRRGDDGRRGPLAHRQRPELSAGEIEPAGFPPGLCVGRILGGVPEGLRRDPAMLRQGTATLTLKRGVIVRGRVTDPAGKPIKDALVVVGRRSLLFQSAERVPDRRRRPVPVAGVGARRDDADGHRPRLGAAAPQGQRPGRTAAAGLPHGSGQANPAADRRCRRQAGPQGRRHGSTGGRAVSRSNRSVNPNHPKVPDPKIPCQADADGMWEWTWAPDDAGETGMSGRTGFAESGAGNRRRRAGAHGDAEGRNTVSPAA